MKKSYCFYCQPFFVDSYANNRWHVANGLALRKNKAHNDHRSDPRRRNHQTMFDLAAPNSRPNPHSYGEDLQSKDKCEIHVENCMIDVHPKSFVFVDWMAKVTTHYFLT